MKKLSVRDITLTALFVAVITLSAWITIPFPVPFTLQIFAVVAASTALGYKKAIACVTVYLLLGVVGVPVFSGFKGGVSSLFGATGGFLLGLLIIAFLVGFSAEKIKSKYIKIIVIALSLLFCWCLGAAWYSFVYSVSFFGVIYLCVVPFVLPDAIKTVFGIYVGQKIHCYIKKYEQY